MIPLSIPSPPATWSQFDIPFGWLHAILPFVAADAALTIHLYALFILAGIVAALIITNYRLTRRGAEPGIIIDISLWTIALGIFVARMYHVVTHIGDFFGPGKAGFAVNFNDASSIWSINQGGDAIFGALLGGALGILIGARQAGLRFFAIADALVPGLMVAQALGRFGNYFNQELFGLPTDLPWGLQIDRVNALSGQPNPAIPVGIGPDTLFHPTFLYEMLWNLVGVVIIVAFIEHTRRVQILPNSGQIAPRAVWIRKPQWGWGRTLGLYLIWYGIGRSWFESIRLDPSQTVFGVRSNVWAALFAVLLGILLVVIQGVRHRGAEPSVYLPGRGPKSDAEIDSDDTYSDVDEPATSGAPATS